MIECAMYQRPVSFSHCVLVDLREGDGHPVSRCDVSVGCHAHQHQAQIRLEMLKCLESSVVWEAVGDDQEVLMLVEATVGRLRDVEVDVVEEASVVLQALPDIVGAEALTACVENLDDGLQALYTSLVDAHPNRSPSALARSVRADKLMYRFIVRLHTCRTCGLKHAFAFGDWMA